jgi:F0F1-type ATP synthase assembly protein I
MRYAGLSTQLLVAIGMAVFIGYKADHWLKTFPLFTSALPLLVLVAIFYKLVRDTSGNNQQGPDHHGPTAGNKKDNETK